MKRTKNHATVVFALLVVAVPALLVTPVHAKKRKPIERYKAQAQTMGTALGKTTFLDIVIYRFSTEEERQLLLDVLKNKGAKELYNVLSKQEDLGFLKVPGSMAYDMRYAWEHQQDDGRMIVMAADRPFTAGEIMLNARTLENSITLLVLSLDASGHGEGQLSIGSELKYDQENNKLLIESLSTQPARLIKVRPD